jgi:hypothetical protein
LIDLAFPDPGTLFHPPMKMCCSLLIVWMSDLIGFPWREVLSRPPHTWSSSQPSAWLSLVTGDPSVNRDPVLSKFSLSTDTVRSPHSLQDLHMQSVYELRAQLAHSHSYQWLLSLPFLPLLSTLPLLVDQLGFAFIMILTQGWRSGSNCRVASWKHEALSSNSSTTKKEKDCNLLLHVHCCLASPWILGKWEK